MSTGTIENPVKFGLEVLKVDNLPELIGWKEKQEKIVKENPFVEIVDNKTYEDGKKARTNLLTARTDVQKQETAIASKIAQFRKEVSKASADLIAITQPHETKQQDEVKRFEAIKEAEKAEKERIEQERKDAIKRNIEDIYSDYKTGIQNLTFQELEEFDMEAKLSEMDTDQFEEFELDFLEKTSLLKAQLKERTTYLNEKEEQRKEAERLEIARKELEAERQKEVERLAVEKKKIEAERKAYEAEQEAKRQKEDEAQKAENDRLAKERAELRAEKDAIEKQKEDFRKKEEAEAKAKADAEEKKRVEVEKKAAEKRVKELRPDIEKLKECIDSIGMCIAVSPEGPSLKSMAAKDFYSLALRRIDALRADLFEDLGELK